MTSHHNVDTKRSLVNMFCFLVALTVGTYFQRKDGEISKE